MLFHVIVSFYYLIIVALSLFMSFFRTTIGVVCLLIWKGLSLLEDFIYVSYFLDGCSFSLIPRSANLAGDYLVNLFKTRIGPFG